MICRLSALSGRQSDVWLTTRRADKLPCYKAKRGTMKRCFSCSSGKCSFTVAPVTASPPATRLVAVVGRLEALAALCEDGRMEAVLRECVEDLKSLY